jgi:excisionase family DNA binding protein
MLKTSQFVAKMYSIPQTADCLGVSESTVKRLIRTNQIATVNIGARVMVNAEELDRVMRVGVGKPRGTAALKAESAAKPSSRAGNWRLS